MARKTIHIPDEWTELIEHLESQYNMSRYICDLIKRDMENSAKKDENEELIGQIKQLMMFNNNPLITQMNQTIATAEKNNNNNNQSNSDIEKKKSAFDLI